MNDSCESSSDTPSHDEQQIVPTEGVLLGLDHGVKRLGIAASIREQTIAGALDNYNRRNEKLDAEYLCKTAKETRAVGIVVGLPVHMSGDEGGQAKLSRTFGKWVHEVTGLPVVYWDERYTSTIADMYLRQSGLSDKKQKARRDKVAAQIMLQSFLESKDRSSKPGAIL